MTEKSTFSVFLSFVLVGDLKVESWKEERKMYVQYDFGNCNTFLSKWLFIV